MICGAERLNHITLPLARIRADSTLQQGELGKGTEKVGGREGRARMGVILRSPRGPRLSFRPAVSKKALLEKK